jgi:hypothetical protein
MIETPPLQVGDVVELRTDLSGRAKLLKAGVRGVVLVCALPWGMVSVSFGGPDPQMDRRPARYFQVHPRHLQKVHP